jgi:Lipid A 3-O-deacylase (PagL)
MLSSALLLASLAIVATGMSGQQWGQYDYPLANPPANPIAENPIPADSGTTPANAPGEDSTTPPKKQRAIKPPDFNRDIYYKNKLEFSLDGGWLPTNIPLPFDVFSGDAYDTYPLKYTLVPIIASLRWHMDDIGGPWFLRGNFDFQFSGSVTAIPRGPETRYLIYIMGIRRNFVPRNSRVAPYFDVRLGVGNIDAKGPIGIYYAQGEPLTFTFNFGSGVRYNFNPRYSISAGVNYMHISNANISQGNGYTNYGINVLGPMVGFNVQLRRRKKHSD